MLLFEGFVRTREVCSRRVWESLAGWKPALLEGTGLGSANTMARALEGIWSSQRKIRKECESRYRERGSHRASPVKARGSQLSAERQKSLERGGGVGGSVVGREAGFSHRSTSDNP